eukprot:TRINITY_DN27609_c0_g1_i2.p1 TRINITY_DN27609_c0_g1~~TRINITY_DN27609_c0_g1_i2.p1  ORF type:complete len:262 (+),score=37.49 TRINITY_DN27609_c0_g1_i2:213-998(+)
MATAWRVWSVYALLIQASRDTGKEHTVLPVPISDCTLQCGSNSDDVSCDMCSGHGLCSIAADSGESTCVCDEGWRGERCDDCSEAAYGISCQLACPKSTIGAVCYGHGTCDSGVYGSGKCTCQTGFDAVESCSMCEDGFTGYPTCGTLCGRDSFAGKVCSGHGTCRSQPNGTCSCETGFSGTRCEINCPVDTAGQLCGGNGVCSSNNNCTCNSPFAANTTTGLCTACVKGYSVSYTHLRAHETPEHLVCRLLLEKKKTTHL